MIEDRVRIYIDMTRTIHIGDTVEAEQQKVYDTVLRAQLAALSIVKPGMVCSDVDKCARDIIADAGYGDYFGHGLGHSVGLFIHEEPRFSMKCDAVLKPGVVITVEPGMFARNTKADINVIALIGERGREVGEFIERDLGAEGLKRSVLVIATSDKPALIRNKAAKTATAIAEYFRDQGKDVLLMMDSLTRFSMAQREIGLASGEPPVTRGYPPSMYSEMPKLLERAGMSDKGSITGLYTVLVDGDDFNEPITDTARSILDGHIVLSRKLGQKNHYPAIDVLQSISRCMSQIVDKKHKQMAGRMKNVMATYNEAEDLINIGAYKSGSNRNIDYAIYKIDAVNKFLMQQTDEKFDFEDEVTQLSDIFADYEAFENGSLQLKK